MKRLVTFATLGAIIFLSSAVQPAMADTSTVMELDRGEPFDAMASQGGVLFVGQSRENFNSHYAIHVLDSAQKLVRTIPMTHSVEHIYPYGSDSVIAMGTAIQPNLRHYTIITIRGRAFDVRDHTVPVTAWGNDWLGTYGGKEYFADMGGNTNDDETTSNPNLDAQTIFSVDPYGRARYLPVRLVGSRNGLFVGDQLLVHHLFDIRNGLRNIHRVNITTGQHDELFVAPRARIWDFLTVDGNILAVAEAGGNRVIFVDRITKQIKTELSVEGEPRSLARVGHCLLVGSRESKSVTVISVRDPLSPAITGSIDFSTTGGAFRVLDKITVDQQSGRVYGRSAVPCNPIIETCEKSWNSVVVSSQDDAVLVKAQCL